MVHRKPDKVEPKITPKYLLSRENLVKLARCQVYKLIDEDAILNSILYGGEYILTDRELLEKLSPVPKYFLSNYTTFTDKRVPADKIKIVYNLPESLKTRHNAEG